MNRTQVTSSLVRSVGYDGASLTLEIEFNSGSVYQYYNVPSSIHTGLMNAGSKGGYIWDHIRDRFRYKRIR